MAEQLETVENIRKQYIVVKIGNEQYGIDISYVDNIVRMQKITRVPRVQNFFKGIINLRGEIVPVMSLRIRMELEEDVFTNASRIIILKIEQQSALGIIVDEVKEVVKTETRSELPVTFDNPILFVLLGVAVVAIVVIAIRIRSLSKKNEK